MIVKAIRHCGDFFYFYGGPFWLAPGPPTKISANAHL